MMGAGASDGTYMKGAQHFDDDEESEMIRKADDDSDAGIHKIESGVGGFDHDPQPKGSVYAKANIEFD
jgi:hypothetical protein